MIDVSDNYAPFAQVRRVGFSAEFRLVDTAAAGNVKDTPSSPRIIARTAQLRDGVNVPSGKFASLEPNLWLLDGSYRCPDLSSASEEVGVWLNTLSGTDAAFSSNVYVTFKLSAPATSIGFTLYFDGVGGTAPAEVVTTAYSGTTVLGTKTDICNGPMLIVELPVENYDSVTFKFTKTALPLRRMRLIEVVFGIVKTYTPDNVASAVLSYGADPIAETFPTRQIKMTIDNSRREYNMRNPSSIYAFLQDGQQIRVSMVIDGEAVDMGQFHFTSATAKDSGLTAEMQANDRAYGWDGAVYSPGSHANEVVTLATAVSYVLSGRGTTVAYASGIQSRTVRVSPPEGSSIRETLRLFAQAARCSVWIDRDGVLRFGELTVATTAAQSYAPGALYSMDGISVRDKVDRVTVNIARDKVDSGEVLYTYGSGDSEVKISNPCVAPANGDAVAKWIYDYYARRLGYSFKNRGDPAVEIGDTVAVADTFGDPGLAVVTAETLTYKGGLYAVTKGVGP